MDLLQRMQPGSGRSGAGPEVFWSPVQLLSTVLRSDTSFSQVGRLLPAPRRLLFVTTRTISWLFLIG